MAMPEAIARALNVVRARHPEVTQVIFGRIGNWLYVDDDLQAPVFDEGDISVKLLEEASTAADKFGLPCAFQYESIPCSVCDGETDPATAHLHQDKYIGECCWDEQLHSSE